MLTYQTTLPQSPLPFSGASIGRSPYRGYGINHADNLRGLSLGVEAAGVKANNDYLQQYGNAQRGLTTSGLQNMAQQQANAMNARDSVLNGLLAGLFS